MQIELNPREITLLLVSLIHRMDLIKSRPDLNETYKETRNLYKRIYYARQEYQNAKDVERVRTTNVAGGRSGDIRT